MKVLHYKSNFLNYSETFIHRIISHHQQFEPAAMCIDERRFTEELPVFAKPKKGLKGVVNTGCFHLNWPLPFYNQTIQQVKPHIIHAHFGFDGYRMIKPALKNNIPLITSFYGSDVTRLPTEFDWKRRYRKLAEYGDAFIAISTHMKTQLVNLGFPESKIHIIPFGLDLEECSFANSSKSTSLMMAGRMVEKKGFRYALEAVKTLSEQNINIDLDLYGDGPLEEQLKMLSRKWKIENHVTFHSYTPIEQIKKAYKNHCILLAPSVTAADSDEEGLPNTILEAMASGTLVIASDHAGISEAVIHNETGYLVPEYDVGAIAESIKTVLSCKTKEMNIRQNARALIEKRFEIGAVIQQTEALYFEVINRHS